LRAASLRLATERAMLKAKAMASAAGARIVGVQSISEEYQGGWNYPYAYSAREASVAAPPVVAPAEAPPGVPEVPGKLRISCQVKVSLLVQ